VTNGKRLFVEGDGNSAWSRRYRDLVAGHVSDLGGSSVLSEAQLSLVRRASAIECELEQMEGRLSMGEEVDLDVFTRSASHLRRILETLGLERRSRNVTPPTLAEYLRATHAAAVDAEQDARPSADVSPGIPPDGLSGVQVPDGAETATTDWTSRREGSS
jgi:hypothetical protein